MNQTKALIEIGGTDEDYENWKQACQPLSLDDDKPPPSLQEFFGFKASVSTTPMHGSKYRRPSKFAPTLPRRDPMYPYGTTERAQNARAYACGQQTKRVATTRLSLGTQPLSPIVDTITDADKLRMMECQALQAPPLHVLTSSKTEFQAACVDLKDLWKRVYSASTLLPFLLPGASLTFNPVHPLAHALLHHCEPHPVNDPITHFTRESIKDFPFFRAFGLFIPMSTLHEHWSLALRPEISGPLLLVPGNCMVKVELKAMPNPLRPQPGDDPRFWGARLISQPVSCMKARLVVFMTHDGHSPQIDRKQNESFYVWTQRLTKRAREMRDRTQKAATKADAYKVKAFSWVHYLELEILTQANRDVTCCLDYYALPDLRKTPASVWLRQTSQTKNMKVDRGGMHGIQWWPASTIFGDNWHTSVPLADASIDLSALYTIRIPSIRRKGKLLPLEKCKRRHVLRVLNDPLRDWAHQVVTLDDLRNPRKAGTNVGITSICAIGSDGWQFKPMGKSFPDPISTHLKINSLAGKKMLLFNVATSCKPFPNHNVCEFLSSQYLRALYHGVRVPHGAVNLRVHPVIADAGMDFPENARNTGSSMEANAWKGIRMSTAQTLHRSTVMPHGCKHGKSILDTAEYLRADLIRLLNNTFALLGVCCNPANAASARLYNVALRERRRKADRREGGSSQRTRMDELSGLHFEVKDSTFIQGQVARAFGLALPDDLHFHWAPPLWEKLKLQDFAPLEFGHVSMNLIKVLLRSLRNGIPKLMWKACDKYVKHLCEINRLPKVSLLEATHTTLKYKLPKKGSRIPDDMSTPPASEAGIEIHDSVSEEDFEEGLYVNPADDDILKWTSHLSKTTGSRGPRKGARQLVLINMLLLAGKRFGGCTEVYDVVARFMRVHGMFFSPVQTVKRREAMRRQVKCLLAELDVALQTSNPSSALFLLALDMQNSGIGPNLTSIFDVTMKVNGTSSTHHLAMETLQKSVKQCSRHLTGRWGPSVCQSIQRNMSMRIYQDLAQLGSKDARGKFHYGRQFRLPSNLAQLKNLQFDCFRDSFHGERLLGFMNNYSTSQWLCNPRKVMTPKHWRLLLQPLPLDPADRASALKERNSTLKRWAVKEGCGLRELVPYCDSLLAFLDTRDPPAGATVRQKLIDGACEVSVVPSIHGSTGGYSDNDIKWDDLAWAHDTHKDCGVDVKAMFRFSYFEGFFSQTHTTWALVKKCTFEEEKGNFDKEQYKRFLPVLADTGDEYTWMPTDAFLMRLYVDCGHGTNVPDAVHTSMFGQNIAFGTMRLSHQWTPAFGPYRNKSLHPTDMQTKFYTHYYYEFSRVMADYTLSQKTGDLRGGLGSLVTAREEALLKKMGVWVCGVAERCKEHLNVNCIPCMSADKAMDEELVHVRSCPRRWRVSSCLQGGVGKLMSDQHKHLWRMTPTDAECQFEDKSKVQTSKARRKRPYREVSGTGEESVSRPVETGEDEEDEDDDDGDVDMSASTSRAVVPRATRPGRRKDGDNKGAPRDSGANRRQVRPIRRTHSDDNVLTSTEKETNGARVLPRPSFDCHAHCRSTFGEERLRRGPQKRRSP